MNNLLSHCGLVDAKIRASDKDLPVHKGVFFRTFYFPDLENLNFLGVLSQPTLDFEFFSKYI